MKLLYIASNPADKARLLLEREITSIQQLFLRNPNETFGVTTLPDIEVESIQQELDRVCPDILHVAAHSDGQSLTIRNCKRERVELRPSDLNAFLSEHHPPKLVYINACDSKHYADSLTALGKVRMAIGSTAPISNDAAVASAKVFYTRILSGMSIKQAFESSRSIAELGKAGLHLAAPGVDTTAEFLYRNPSLVAGFMDEPPKRRSNGSYAFRLGIIGCPPNTHHVVFFTDDASFAHKPNQLEKNMCLVVRDTPVRGALGGEFWCPDLYDFEWTATEDMTIYAVGVSPSGEHFVTLPTQIGEAVERYLVAEYGNQIPKQLRKALTKFTKGCRPLATGTS